MCLVWHFRIEKKGAYFCGKEGKGGKGGSSNIYIPPHGLSAVGNFLLLFMFFYLNFRLFGFCKGGKLTLKKSAIICVYKIKKTELEKLSLSGH